ncbi:MAG: TonB family protein [Candidatus Thiodiazotropha sp.]
MIRSNAGWRMLALSLSLLLHLMLVTNWSEKMIATAAVEEKMPPMLVQLSFQRPLPEPIPEVVTPPEPPPKKVVKPKPKPKPKIKKKRKTKPIPKPVVVERQPAPPAEEKQVVAKPPPPRVQPRVDLRAQYLAKLLAKIEANKYYPTVARRRQIEGKIEVSFSLACDGKVSELKISGRHGLLRKAAGKAIDAAQPLPHPPSQVECPMPVNYAMAYTLEK